MTKPNTATKQNFLHELSILLDIHKVAICSRILPKSEYTEVFFQLKGEYNIHTKRCHSTGYEIQGVSSGLVLDLEQEIELLKNQLMEI